MHKRLDFTYDPVVFGDLPALVADIHNHSQRYVIMTVSCPNSYQEDGKSAHNSAS